MKKYSFDAVIFDLDGVITQTASVHGTAWKEMFDNYLKEREEKHGEPFKEFTHENDYLPYVDGKPRYKGVQSFLESRGIDIPFGNPSDPPEKETACGLGNRKNVKFTQILERDGAKVFDSTVELIHQLRDNNIKIGVASSSKNCKKILEVAGLLDLFQTRVDGVVSAELGLSGKPGPDIFTTACDNLGVTYDKAVVVEDAVSGVQAGKKGNFGFTLGIAREKNHKELKINGADIVVQDISELGGIDGIELWFREGLEHDNWSISYHSYDPGKEKTREALLAVGNGYFTTRGAQEETVAGKTNYPGTYMASLYNKLDSVISGETITNEDFVNCPNWLYFNFKINDGDWLDINNTEIISVKRDLNLKTGELTRDLVVKDSQGNETFIRSQRVASMAKRHQGAIRYALSPLNYTGRISLKTGLNGNIINAGVERYQALNQNHLKPLKTVAENNVLSLLVETTTSGIQVAETAKLNATMNGNMIAPGYTIEEGEGEIYATIDVDARKGDKIEMDKLMAIYSSLPHDDKDPWKASRQEITTIHSYDEIYTESSKKWEELWGKMDIKLEGDRYAQKLLRLHLYHLLVTASDHSKDIDFGIPPRGLHGEAYRGHIFWDELYVLPLYYMHYPGVAKSCLDYRYNRIDEAKKNAKESGYEGAMFPWQSGSDGSEESQIIHLNPVSGEWDPDYSSLQRHISIAIAYNLWGYVHYTRDFEYLAERGAELFFEICRFWASKSKLNKGTGRYEIKNVMGPDEFHEKYPGANEGGLKDNTYTNIMVVWLFKRAFEFLDKLNEMRQAGVLKKIHLKNNEIDRWHDIAQKMNVVINEEGILAQFEGYFDLKELDWDAYREKYDDIHRMDRILKAEGKSPDAYKVSKQADVLMTFYTLDEKDVTEILTELGYKLPPDYLKRNYHYYLERTSHGSTLSRVVHGYLANQLNNEELAWKFYIESIESDYNDIQGGTTAEGIHVGVMGGTVLQAITCFVGLNLKKDIPIVVPNLPPSWKKIKFNFYFKENHYTFEVSKSTLNVFVKPANKDIWIQVNDKKTKLTPGEWNELNV